MSSSDTDAPDDHQLGADPHETLADALAEEAAELTPPPAAWSRHLTARFDHFDDVVDAQFDRLRGRPAVDRVMYSITELADFSLLWHLLAGVQGLRSDRHAAEALRVSVVLGVEATVVNAGLKSLFRRERPVPDFERPHHLRIPLTTSLPSGHASAAFCAATLLSEGRPRPVRIAWYGLAGLVAASRVHVKIHHASDVLGGVVVGVAAGHVARRAWRRPH